MSNPQSPRIGISSVLPVGTSLSAIMTQVRSAGAEPVMLHHTEVLEGDALSAHVAADLANLDGLIVMGNNYDIDPARYGQEVHEKTHVESNAARANFEYEAISQALEMKMPMLGICGGHQRINTLDHETNGGTLHQHVPDVVGHEAHMQGDTIEGIPPFTPVQFIKIEPGSMLEEIADGVEGVYAPDHNAPKQVMENSFHHQAIDQVHQEFQVAATSEDGIVEAIEPKSDGKYGDQFVLGVQWHPEFGASHLAPKITERLVEEARAYAQNKSHPEIGEHTARLAGESCTSALHR